MNGMGGAAHVTYVADYNRGGNNGSRTYHLVDTGVDETLRRLQLEHTREWIVAGAGVVEDDLPSGLQELDEMRKIRKSPETFLDLQSAQSMKRRSEFWEQNRESVFCKQ